MQLHTYVEGRLLRWSVWYHSGANPKPPAVASWWGKCVMDRHVADPGRIVPPKVDVTEAMETDRAVRALAAEMRETIFEVWTRGGTMEQKARALGCHRTTLYDRIERANVKLLGYMNDIAAGLPLPEPEPYKIKLTRPYKNSNLLVTVA